MRRPDRGCPSRSVPDTAMADGIFRRFHDCVTEIARHARFIRRHLRSTALFWLAEIAEENTLDFP